MPANKEPKETTTKNNPVENVTGKMKKSPLHKFFLDGLKDMYYAEKTLVSALKKMQEAATTGKLKDAFEEHRLQTQVHRQRLEEVFGLLNENAEEKECHAINGLIKEAKEIISGTQEGTMTRDAALIIAAQKIEHYEIASYGGLAQLAITMEHHKVAEILEKILEEEEETDQILTDIAETSINFEAEEEN